MGLRNSKPWFAAKRFGYGSSLPTAWEGWAALAAFLGAVMLSMMLPWPPAKVAGVLIATSAFVLLCAFKTEGGWHWRWGGKP